jgi:hypothetical protein
VPAVCGVQEGAVVRVRGFGDELFQRDEAADLIAGVVEERIGQGAGNATVAAREGVDREEIEDEQADQQHGMVATLRDRCEIAIDELAAVELGLGGRDRDEPDLDRSVRRPIHGEVVVAFELSPGQLCVGEELPVQVA